jgi:hypothetical protein
MAVLVTPIQWMAGSCPSTDPARLRRGELAIRRCAAAVALTPEADPAKPGWRLLSLVQDQPHVKGQGRR